MHKSISIKKWLVFAVLQSRYLSISPSQVWCHQITLPEVRLRHVSKLSNHLTNLIRAGYESQQLCACLSRDKEQQKVFGVQLILWDSQCDHSGRCVGGGAKKGQESRGGSPSKPGQLETHLSICLSNYSYQLPVTIYLKLPCVLLFPNWIPPGHAQSQFFQLSKCRKTEKAG